MIRASSRLMVTPDTMRFSTISSSSQIRVPPLSGKAPSESGSMKLDRTRTGTRLAMASSTERVCSTLAPSEAISSISS